MKAVIFDYNRTIYNPDTDQLMDGAKQVLDQLQKNGVTLFLIAKGDDERKKRIETLGLIPYFKGIIVNQKKSAEDYQDCLSSCEKGTTFFAVGDRIKEEIRHANSCGITTIWFRNGKFANEEPERTEEQPRHTVRSLAEIPDLILFDLDEHYRKRAREYESVYHRDDPVRQAEQIEIGKEIEQAMRGRRVLEIACGTGYWTERAAKTALHIVAIDAVPETLEVARSKKLPDTVEFRVGDAYALSESGPFDAGLAMCWFSHVPKARIHGFLSGFHSALAKGAKVFIGDNMYVQGVGGELISKPGFEDTFKRRTLPDGTVHDVLKNYFDRQHLEEIFLPFAEDLKIAMGERFWRVQYRVK